ncbi:hypothetical protein [Sorangium sp. So ce131]|uniref:hypothetical protein n=1 Tax=Sorangium sp. So ce131 TaxID=3133282 RepID=UPI003F619149
MSSISHRSRAFLVIVALSVAPACSGPGLVPSTDPSECGPGSEQEGGHDPECGGSDEPSQACASFEGTGCYRLDDVGGEDCWIATDEAPSIDECFAMDSCYGGLGQSRGSCYKWADGSDAPPYTWPTRPTQGSACASLEGLGCYWMETVSGRDCWVAVAFSKESCLARDECRDGGGCYKWSDGSDGDPIP